MTEQCELPFTPVRMGQIHAARLSESPRLQRLAKVLAGGGWHSTRGLMLLAELCAVNSAVAELRANGIGVECRCVGRGRYEYRRVMT